MAQTRKDLRSRILRSWSQISSILMCFNFTTTCWISRDFRSIPWKASTEALGLHWEDLDYEKRSISINHNLVYYPTGNNRSSEQHISKPKTEAGIRTIPMLDSVKNAFEMLWEEQKENGWNEVSIDGMTGFVFSNRFGNVPNRSRWIAQSSVSSPIIMLQKR